MAKSKTSIILKNHIKDLSEKSQEKKKRNKQIYDYDNYKFKYDKNMDIIIMEDMERNFISKFKDAKTDTKYYKYYAYTQRPKCKGRIKKTINENKFYICKRCDMNINHDLLNYNEIKDLLDKKQHKNINFSVERYQKYFCK